MKTESKGGDLFIVDNSISGWTALRYLQQWTEIAKSFDIATGFFEIGSLLELDSNWQKLDKIRILMGSETTSGTKKVILKAVKERAEAALDGSLEEDKVANPFLRGAPAIVEAMKAGQIECRIYNRDKFHAKAYITHAKLDVVGAQALVGSSNFTRPGLTQNIELNIQIQSGSEVAQLQEWFNEHWEVAEDVSGDLISVIERHTREYTPFEVYAKALQEFFRGHEMTAGEWDQSGSKMFPVLDRYQQEAYWALMKIARQHGGAFLCDGVGLGKTFVGLMLIERLIRRERKRVVLFAPKAAKEGVWEPHLRRWLPDIGGGRGGVDFSLLALFSHTDLNRKGDFPERFRRISEFADVVIVDEAHHFRNPGRQGDPAKGIEPSRYHQLYSLLDHSARPKSLFMLTATPINNQLSDFRHMAELFTRRDEGYFAQTLGVNNLRSHFVKMDKELKAAVGEETLSVADHMADAQGVLAQDQFFKHLVVQRSRSYAQESQRREGGNTAVFPKRLNPQVAEYSIKKTYGRLLNLFKSAFARDAPLFTLPMYYPLAWYTGPDEEINPVENNRQKQVVGLIRTNFLKRFESSVAAFEVSCDRLLQKLLAFVEVHSLSESEKDRLDRWKKVNAEVLGYAHGKQIEMWGEDSDDESDEEDVVPQELLDSVERLDSTEFDLSEMLSEAFVDLDQIVKFLEESSKFKPEKDDKLRALLRRLRSKELVGQKVIIFTEFADTARYLRKQLQREGIDGVFQIDSGTKANRAEIIKRFAPYYNEETAHSLAESGHEEIRVLISTDVLSEGLNLQDACRMINYDIHWNPVRLMQRIGRVDRRMNPETEAKLLEDHPDLSSIRGSVRYWNFLPPDELNEILTLYKKVTQKTLLISRTFGIEGKKLLTPEDDYDALKEFTHAYEGTRTAVEDMHLEYQELLLEDPELESRLQRLPGATFSGRKRPAKGARGVFFCYALPALDKELGEFTEEAGTTRWYLYDLDREAIFGEPGEISASIRSKPSTPRRCDTEEKTLVEIRTQVLKHIKNTYEKQLNVPINAPKPALKCWMELNDG